MKKLKDSTALTFMNALWSGALASTGHSWQRLNVGMYHAVSLAITTGLTFANDDIKFIYTEFRGQYWFGDRGWERWYSEAIEVGNNSAWKSIEAFRNRDPFIFDGQRLHVGSTFRYDGRDVTVTSFNDDSACMVACSYKKRVLDKHGSYGQDKIEKRYKITNESLLKNQAAMRKRRELLELLRKTDPDAEVFKRLKVNGVGFERLPIKTVEKVLAEMKA